MKIQINQGCTTDSIFINDKDCNNYSPEEQAKIIDYITSKLKDKIQINTYSFIYIMGFFEYDSFESESVCDQCGDAPTTTIYNI